MSRWWKRWPVRNEDGVYLVLYAVLIVALLLMVGIVVDLGAVREDRRLNRSTADAAATAGAMDLLTSAELACTTAWDYALENLNLSPATSPCAAFPPCTATSTETVRTASVGDYTISITNPVITGSSLLNADAVGPNITQPVSPTADGSQCNRLGVSISFTRDSTFARVVGINETSTTVHSVGLRIVDDNGVPLSLIVLHPTDCGVLTSSGSGGIEVTGTAPNLVGGVLAVSNATTNCGGSTPLVLDAGGTSHISAQQPSHIFVAAMSGPTCSAPACSAGQIDVTAPLGDRGVYPPPEDPLVVPDRSLVDGRYNCRANYSGTSGGDQNYRTVYRRGTSGPILPACTSTQVTNPESDFVNHLYREVQAGALEPLTPTIYTDCGTIPAVIAGPSRIDCAMPNNFTLTVNGNVWFNNGAIITPASLVVNGNAVFNGGITMGTGNALTVNGNAEFRGGEVRVTGDGSFTLQGSTSGLGVCSTTDFVLTPTDCVRRSSTTANFAYVGTNVTGFLMKGAISMPATTVFGAGGPTDTSTQGPIIDVGGGGGVTWRAPTAGPFQNLLGWSDKVSTLGTAATWHNLAGGGGLTLEGIFFSPLAKVRMTGGSTVTPLRAQFWAAALAQEGSSVFSMTPDGSFILVPVGTGTRLIR